MKAELMMFLSPLLSADLGAFAAHVRDQDGFELWRLITREKDPVQVNTAFHLESEIALIWGSQVQRPQSHLEAHADFKQKKPQ